MGGALLLSMAACSSEKGRERSPIAVGDTITISVLTSTDLHGWIHAWDYATDTADERYSMAKVATLVDSVREVQPFTMLLDAGDWLQGNQLAAFYANEQPDAPYYPLLKAAELMNYDAFVLGNHEFNFGIEYLNTRLAQSPGVAYLGANIYTHGTQDPAYTPYIIRNVGGVQVAVVGLTTPGSAIWDRPRVSGRLDFVDGVAAGRRFVAEARAAGAELVVILAHCGLESGSSYHDSEVPLENFGRELLEQVPGIDLFVFGHSHRVTENVFVANADSSALIPVIQAGRWASHLGEAELVVTRAADGSVEVVTAQTRAFPVVDVKPSERIIQATQAYHDATRNFVNKPLATTPDRWTAERGRLEDSPIVDLIHKVQLEVTGAQLSAAAVFNTSADFGPGNISRKEMALIYPYENMLYMIQVTGRQLKLYLEQSARFYARVENGEPVVDRSIPGFNFDTIAGVEYEMDLRRPIGQRLTRLTYQGRPVSDTQTFTLALNSYRAEGGGNYSMLADAPVEWTSEVSVRTYLEEYLEILGEISHDTVFEQNWKFIW